jgi:hypothetical protein
MTIHTTTDETFEAQLRADDQDVLWLIDATDGRYQLAVALQRCRPIEPGPRPTLTNAEWWARVVEARAAHEDLLPKRVWTLHKGEHAAAIHLQAVPGIGAEIVLTVDGEMRKTRLFRSHEQAELVCAIADTRTMFEGKGWA